LTNQARSYGYQPPFLEIHVIIGYYCCTIHTISCLTVVTQVWASHLQCKCEQATQW